MKEKKASSLLSNLSKNIAILDIGSSKIVCLIASINNNNINIIGKGCQSANGFKNGNITDSKKAKSSIIAAVDQAEKSANITIDKVVLALNGNKIRSHYLQISTNLKKGKVLESDIKHLVNQGLKTLENQDYEVIHYFPLEYIIDGERGINDPLDLIGNKLSSCIHFVTASAAMIENIINCLAGCQLDVEDCIFAPYAYGVTYLNDSNKEFGTTIIDFGSGITSYAIFSNNKMVHCGFIPVGGQVITNDIAKSFMLDLSTAERIKTIHGSATISNSVNHKMISYKTDYSLPGQYDNDERSISNTELNNVINARIEEILSILYKIFKKHDHLSHNARHNIILTGGGSMLNGINGETAKILGSKVKIGKPAIIPGMNQDTTNATYASAVGVLKYISKNHNYKQSKTSRSSLFKEVIQWLKDNF